MQGSLTVYYKQVLFDMSFITFLLLMPYLRWWKGPADNCSKSPLLPAFHSDRWRRLFVRHLISILEWSVKPASLSYQEYQHPHFTLINMSGYGLFFKLINNASHQQTDQGSNFPSPFCKEVIQV